MSSGLITFYVACSGHTRVRSDLCSLGRFFSRSHVVFLCSLAELLTAIGRQLLRIRADALSVGCSCVSFFCEYSRALLLGNKPNLPGTSGDLEAGSELCLVEHSLLLMEAGLLRAQPRCLVTYGSQTVVAAGTRSSSPQLRVVLHTRAARSAPCASGSPGEAPASSAALVSLLPRAPVPASPCCSVQKSHQRRVCAVP